MDIDRVSGAMLSARALAQLETRASRGLCGLYWSLVYSKLNFYSYSYVRSLTHRFIIEYVVVILSTIILVDQL